MPEINGPKRHSLDRVYGATVTVFESRGRLLPVTLTRGYRPITNRNTANMRAGDQQFGDDGAELRHVRRQATQARLVTQIDAE